MRSDGMSARSIEWIFLSIIGVLFYWLNFYSVMAYDDWYYAMICEDAEFFKSGAGRTPIETVGDIFVSQCNHYQCINGRFLLHFIVQLFAGILGMRAFQVASTVMFVVLVRYLCRLCVPSQYRDRILFYILTFMVFWFAMGLFVDVGFAYMSTIAFSVNYLWSSALFVWVIYEYCRYKDGSEQVSGLRKWALSVLAFMCGASNEAFSVGLSAALFLNFCIRPKSFTGVLRYIAVGLWMGAAVSVLAPGNLNRFIDANAVGMRTRLDRLMNVATPMLGVIIMGLISAVLCRKRLYELYKENRMLLWTALATILFLMSTGFGGARQMFIPVIIIAIVVLLKVIFRLAGVRRFGKILTTLSIVLFAVHYVLVLDCRKAEKADFNRLVEEYFASDAGLVVYSPVKRCDIISSYGLDVMTFNHMGFILGGINMCRCGMAHCAPVLIPDLSQGVSRYPVVNDNEKYIVYDAEYFWLMKEKNGNCHSVISHDFSYENPLVNLGYAWFVEKPGEYDVVTKTVTVDGERYIVIDKIQNKIIINGFEAV